MWLGLLSGEAEKNERALDGEEVEEDLRKTTWRIHVHVSHLVVVKYFVNYVYF